jgi:peptidylprolyl isomerase
MHVRFLAAVLLSAAIAVAEPTTPAGIPPLPSVIQWHATPSGMQYADIAIGRGPNPKAGQVVVVHFSGWLDDGTKFDSTHDRKKAFGFPVGSGQVIKGWDECVRTMQVGGKRRLVVPPQLAYGAKGVPGLVPSNARLTFDIELLRIIDQPSK